MPCCTCCGVGRYMGLNQCSVKRERGNHTNHPAVVIDTLQKGHRLGSKGLARIFSIGSEWHYGPCYENMETHVRVIEHPRQNAGPRPLRDHNLAEWITLKNGRRECTKEGPRTWFVKVIVLSSKFHEAGTIQSLPPCALIPRAAVEWERSTFGIQPGEAPTPVELAVIRDEAEKRCWWLPQDCSCGFMPTCPRCAPALPGSRSETIIGGLERALEAVESENARLRSENGVLKGHKARLERQRNEARDKLAKVRDAVR